MKLKKSLVCALSATMTFGTISVVNVHAEEPQFTSVSEAAVQNPDSVVLSKSLKEIDKTVLAQHAKSNSEKIQQLEMTV